MSKKYYEMIASWMVTIINEWKLTEEIQEQMMKDMKADNPMFSPEKFMERIYKDLKWL